MPRQPRPDLAGVPQHVVQRGNDRQACFFGEVDYRAYLTGLREASLRYGCALHAYVLMTAKTGSGSLPAGCVRARWSMGRAGTCKTAGLGLDHGAEVVSPERALLLEIGADVGELVIRQGFAQ